MIIVIFTFIVIRIVSVNERKDSHQVLARLINKGNIEMTTMLPLLTILGQVMTTITLQYKHKKHNPARKKAIFAEEITSDVAIGFRRGLL